VGSGRGVGSAAGEDWVGCGQVAVQLAAWVVPIGEGVIPSWEGSAGSQDSGRVAQGARVQSGTLRGHCN